MAKHLRVMWSEILLSAQELPKSMLEKLHTNWTTYGHHIRSQIGDDAKLVTFLRHVLPKYTGGEVTLYRGENVERWRNKKVGFCWSPSIETARMFGQGLNSTPVGGVLLKCMCQSGWIIAGPSKHSKYLGEEEFTLNPYLLKNIEIVEQYEPID